MTRRISLLLALGVGATACADIDAWDLEECGNNVVEPEAEEDCDLIVDPALGDDLQCGPPDGTPGQCRYVCDGAECPRGWTCGDDGLCRAPSGEFEVDDEPRALAAAQQIALFDVFGSEEAELVARIDGDVMVFGGDAEGFGPRSELTIAAARGDFFFADVDEDARADILVPAAARELDASAEPRVHVLRDDGERLVTAVVPQRFVPEPLAAVVAVDVGTSGAQVILQIVRGEAGTLAALVEPSNCAAPPVDARIELPLPAEASIPHPQATRSLADGTSEVAIAASGSSEVAIVHVRRECGAGVCSPAHEQAEPCATHLAVQATVTMPAAVADPACRFLDVDDAFGPDLVCHLQGDRFGVALDDGTDLGAGADGAAWLSGLDALPAAQSRGCAPIARILAVADLDDDGRADVVTPHGLFHRDSDGGWVRAYARTLGDGWAEAAVGDFDRDGRADVVATVAQLADGCAPRRVQALAETGGAYATRVVRNTAEPSHLRVGDFDADGIDDVGLVEPRSDGVWVTALFGAAQDALGDAVSVGGFSRVDDLAAVRSREGTEVNEDLVGDLAIVSEAGDALTLVTGTTMRSPLSPLALTSKAADGRVPAVVLAGSLVPRDAASAADEELGPPDVLALRGSEAWLLRDEDVHHGDEPLVLASDPFGIRPACSTWAVTTPRPEGGSTFAGIDGHPVRVGDAAHGCDLSTPPRLVVARLGGSRADPIPQIAIATVAGPMRRPTALSWLDLDGSGADDLLVHFDADGEARRGSLAWVRDADPGTAPMLASLVPDLDVWAATPIDADADPAIEIAVLTADGLRILDPVVDEGALTIHALDPVFEAPRVPMGDELVRLVAGDVDGNEIADLALLVADAIYIYPALERE